MVPKLTKSRPEKPTLGSDLSYLSRQACPQLGSSIRATSAATSSGGTLSREIPTNPNDSESSLVSFPTFSSPAENENLRVLFEKTSSSPPTPQPKSPTFPGKASPVEPTVILPRVEPNLMSDPGAIDQARRILCASPGISEHSEDGGHMQDLEKRGHHRQRSAPGEADIQDLFLYVPQPRRASVRVELGKHEMDTFSSVRNPPVT